VDRLEIVALIPNALGYPGLETLGALSFGFGLKVGLGISRTNADSQWNPVYNAFHRNSCCGNETIRR